MRKKLLLFFTLLPVLDLSAQISELEEVLVSSSGNYIHYTSVIRNYNDTINILMQYGRFQTDMATDSAVGHCTFYTQNTNTGVITRLFDLTRGYKVNDVRFVTLRKMDGVSTEDFCCFCGTRSQFEMYEYPISLDPGALPIEIHSKHGFAGFFSMSDALNPTASCTVKFRDVESTKGLYRMTCYAEKYGQYYHNQSSYIDNAVLDIIGTDDTLYRPSCFCRAKFYPVYPGGVHWDNNMRVNMTEILTDITKTDDYVVTVSHNTNGDSLWIRHSEVEDHLVSGGLELNDFVNAIDFQSTLVEDGCENNMEIGSYQRRDDAKICHTTGNGVEMGFYFDNLGYGGIISGQYDYINGTMTFLRGAYLKSSPLIKELVYLPANDATAVLYNESLDFVSVLKWEEDGYCKYPIRRFYHDNISAQSITLQERNGYEHLLWSGRKTDNAMSNMFLMTQRGEQGNGYTKTCHKQDSDVANPTVLEHATVEKQMRITIRYPFDEERYPVKYKHFNPEVMDREFPCEK